VSGPIPSVGGSSRSSVDSLALGLGLTFGLLGLFAVIYLAYRIRMRRKSESVNETESLVDNSAYTRQNEI